MPIWWNSAWTNSASAKPTGGMTLNKCRNTNVPATSPHKSFFWRKPPSPRWGKRSIDLNPSSCSRSAFDTVMISALRWCFSKKTGKKGWYRGTFPIFLEDFIECILHRPIFSCSSSFAWKYWLHKKSGSDKVEFSSMLVTSETHSKYSCRECSILLLFPVTILLPLGNLQMFPWLQHGGLR